MNDMLMHFVGLVQGEYYEIDASELDDDSCGKWDEHVVGLVQGEYYEIDANELDDDSCGKWDSDYEDPARQ
ncbi:hypothetical protein GOP47_0022927 [Adiantum capillus-veneris]|uniref:Uncharacterized protein n=1 Tax=Adiantum capillus-veneris TaxID=13818 RepID=A0A9D4U7E9_ADICA|nr:hypothetical protein GOP47_0022927 [Adiantum capillus-veneris]